MSAFPTALPSPPLATVRRSCRLMPLPKLRALLDGLDQTDIARLAERAASAREIVYAATGGAELRQQIIAAYRQLEAECGPSCAVAVRSSATAEDLPNASFAGQHESYLNIRGDEALVEACRRCFASLFTDRAIVYRVNNGFDHFKVALSVGIMKMIRSDLGSSGVMFTLDTESGFRDAVFITGVYGLGETIVQGQADPDEFYVHKPTFKKGFRAVLRRSLGKKQLRMVYADASTGETTHQFLVHRSRGGALLHRRQRRAKARRIRNRYRRSLFRACWSPDANGH